MEVDLDNLERTTREEQQAIGFATFAAGIAVSTVLGWIALGEHHQGVDVAYGTASAVSGTMTAWFSMKWWSSRRDRRSLISRIRKL